MPEQPAQRLRRADDDATARRPGPATLPSQAREPDRQLAADDRRECGREPGRDPAAVRGRGDVGPVEDGHAVIPSRRSTICCTSR